MLKPLPIRMTPLLIWFCLISCSFIAEVIYPQAIPRANVKGRVLDDSTSTPLPMTNVFVANSTIGSAADSEGRFELKGVPLGTQEIVASILGYAPESVKLRLIDVTEYEVEFRLRPSVLQLPMVVVEAKEPTEWRSHLERFIDDFFGSTSSASKCRLLNPEVLDFTVDEETSQFRATAREHLEVENGALGYSVQYFLQFFTETHRTIQFVALTKFKPLQAQNEDEMKQWKINRRNAYYGSRRHFLSALARKKTKDEGFKVSSVKRGSLYVGLLRSAGDGVDADTLLIPGSLPFERRLSFQDLLQVVYTRGEPESAYCDSLRRVLSRYFGPVDRTKRISLIELDRPSVTIYTNGIVSDALSIYTHGYWSYQRAAEMLPIDYEPE